MAKTTVRGVCDMMAGAIRFIADEIKDEQRRVRALRADPRSQDS